MQQCLTDFTHLVNLVPAGSMDSESEPKQHNLLGQDRYPTQNMFWQNKKTVAQFNRSMVELETDKSSYASNFDKKTPEWLGGAGQGGLPLLQCRVQI